MLSILRRRARLSLTRLLTKILNLKSMLSYKQLPLLKTVDYYKKADESAAYYTASVLDPAFKWSWFEDRWGNDKVKKFWLDGNPAKKEIGVKGLVRELWEEEYKGKYGSNSTPAIRKDSPKLKNPDDRFGGLHMHKQL